MSQLKEKVVCSRRLACQSVDSQKERFVQTHACDDKALPRKGQATTDLLLLPPKDFISTDLETWVSLGKQKQPTSLSGVRFRADDDFHCPFRYRWIEHE